MNDQAYRLRELIKHSQQKHKKGDNSKKDNDNTRIIAVTSGKGGVGKTNFTVNLAVTLNNLGHRVVIFDADIGLANVDILLGLTSKYNISSILNGEKDIEDIMLDGPKGLKIIPGGSGIEELIDMNNRKVDILVNQLEKLKNSFDFIIIDTGAGLSNTVISFVNAANEVILVTTPEPTSLTDVYAMIKTLNTSSHHTDFNIVINRVKNEKEANIIFDRLNRVSNKFLDININKLGFLNESKLVFKAVKRQEPFTSLYPNSLTSKNLIHMANEIVEGQKSKEKGLGFDSFIKKFKNFFTKEAN